MDTNKSISLGKAFGQDSALVTPAEPNDCNLAMSGFLQRIDGLGDRLSLSCAATWEFRKVLDLLRLVPRKEEHNISNENGRSKEVKEGTYSGVNISGVA